LIRFMNSRLKTILYSKFPIYLLFLILHLVFFKVNLTEWGDSYRILRASTYLQRLDYPQDEKRPPFFSALLAAIPTQADATQWGRGLMLGISIISFIVFDCLSSLWIKDRRYQKLSLLLLTLNPVYFYWSLRIMADVLFALFCMLIFYLVSLWTKKYDFGKTFLIGFITGLAILTRFEGYLLFGSVLMVAVVRVVRSRFKKEVGYLLVYALATILTILPFLFLRNPLNSQYFGEPGGRVYNSTTIWIYLVSLMFMFGFTSAFLFIKYGVTSSWSLLKQNQEMVTFLILELVLILLWPAAIPRLFVCIVPFLIILLSLGVKSYLARKEEVSLRDLGLCLALLVTYVVSQYFLKLQFLIVVKEVFLVVVGLQLVSLILLKQKKFKLFLGTILISSGLWSVSTVLIHRNIYSAVHQAALYIEQNLKGTVVYNDTTSNLDWYINFEDPRGDLKGYYLGLKTNETGFIDKGANYLVVTNEEVPELVLGDRLLSNLQKIKEFRYNISGKEFYANIYKVLEKQ
jgi:4-amino-4-deoxy-L-arabinose transferase-like glycosyltransferase